MLRKSLMAAAVIGALSATSSFANARDVPPPPPPGAPGMGPMNGHRMGGPGAMGGPGMEMMFLGGVDLTKAQKEQIHAVFKDRRDAKFDDGKKVHDLHEQIAAILMAPGKIDDAKLTSLSQEIDAIRSKQEAQRLSDAVKIHDILTPAQLQAIQDKRAKIDALHKQLFELTKPPAGPGGPGPDDRGPGDHGPE